MSRTKQSLMKNMTGFAAVLALVIGIAFAWASQEIAYADTEYELWVGGVQVTESNKDDIFSGSTNGNSGTASFDPSTNTLTLKDATVAGRYMFSNTYEPYYAGIYSNDFNLTIVSEGDNKIQYKDGTDGDGRIYGIYCDVDKTDDSDLTIEGGGKLEIKSREACIHVDQLNIKDADLTVENTYSYAYDTIFTFSDIVVENSNVNATHAGAEGALHSQAGSIIIKDSHIDAQSNRNQAFRAKTSIQITGSAIVTPETSEIKKATTQYAEYYTVFDASDDSEAKHVVIDLMYTITAEETEHGTVTLSADEAVKGKEITVTATPDDGYELDSITVKDAEGNDVSIEDNKFTMPASDVTVSVSFAEKESEPSTDEDSGSSTDTGTDTETSTVSIPSGVVVASLRAKGSTGLTVSWTRMANVDGYEIYYAPCNLNGKKSSYKLAKNASASLSKWSIKGLKKHTAYKFYIKAYVKNNGKKTYVYKSLTAHAYTGGWKGKYSNAVKVTVTKAKISLRKGKTYKIKGSKVTTVKKSKKLMPKGHVKKFRYVSSNTKVAKVTAAGKIKGISKGKCKVYVISPSGVYKTISVTVK